MPCFGYERHGDDELSAGVVQLKDMIGSTQKSVALDTVVGELKSVGFQVVNGD